MESSFIFSLEKNYSSLKMVRDVALSRREIDTIACLLSGKSVKSIAFFLFVSPRTVETYVRTVMFKFGCNSREGIIEFVEKSDQFLLIQDHYLHLLRQSAFKQCLQKIATLNKHNDPVSVVLYEPTTQKPNNKQLHQLAKYLELAGVNISLEEKNQPSFSFMESVPVIGMVCRKEEAKDIPIVFLVGGSFQLIDDMPEELKKIGYVNLVKPEDYSTFFDILRKIMPATNLDAIVSEFQKQDRHHPVISLETPSIQAPSLINTILPVFRQSKKTLMGGGIIGMILIGFLFFVFQYNPFKISHETISIRSDLSIPHQKALLDRSQILGNIEDTFKSQKPGIQSVTLVGAGGAGKTTIARLYAISQNSPIVWGINAETKENLLNSFKDLAYALSKTPEQKSDFGLIQKISNALEQEKQLLFYVKKRLREEAPWFLIYDNVETLSDIKDFLPEDKKIWGCGKIVITTRDINSQNTSYIDPSTVIEIGELEKTDALTLFCKILYDCHVNQLTPLQQKEINNFLQYIQTFTLDVSIAAYYIKNTQITLDQYLERIQKSTKEFDQSQTSILKNVNHCTKTRYGIINTSLEKIIGIHPDYKDLLFLICLGDSQNIPVNLLASSKDKLIVEQFLYQLKKHALITSEQKYYTNQKFITFSIHRLTEQAGRNFLFKKFNTKIEQPISDALFTVLTYSEKCIEENFRMGFLFLPHLQELLKYSSEAIPTSDSSRQFLQEILYAIGNTHYRCSRNLILAKEYFIKAYKERLTLERGLSNEKTILLLKNLGMICNDLELADEAIFYAHESIKLAQNVPNATLIKAENFKTLGCAYTYKNDFTQAKSYFEKALTQISSLKGKERKDLESCIYSSLGWLYSVTFIAQKKVEPAITYLQKALKMTDGDKTFYGGSKKEKIPSYVVGHKVTLGDIYCRAGLYDKALNEGFKDAKFIIDSTLDEHPNELLNVYTLIGISEILLRKGDLSGSKESIQKTLMAIKKIAGEDSSLALSTKIFGIEVNIRLGELDEAYKDCEEIFNFQIKSKTNYSILLYLTTFYYAAMIKYKQEDYEEAIKHFGNFFKLIEGFCQEFFNEQEYHLLKTQGLFEVTPTIEKQEKHQVIRCLKKALEIYTHIYGQSHAFVKDFVLPATIEQ